MTLSLIQKHKYMLKQNSLHLQALLWMDDGKRPCIQKSILSARYLPIIVIDKKYHLTDIEDGITLGEGLSHCSLSATEIDSRLRTLTLKSPLGK